MFPQNFISSSLSKTNLQSAKAIKVTHEQKVTGLIKNNVLSMKDLRIKQDMLELEIESIAKKQRLQEMPSKEQTMTHETQKRVLAQQRSQKCANQITVGVLSQPETKPKIKTIKTFKKGSNGCAIIIPKSLLQF